MQQTSNNKTLRTYPIKGYTIFVGVVSLVSLAAIILFIFLKNELLIIRILVFVMCGLFFILGLICFLSQISTYIEVKSDILISHKLFVKTKVELNKITSIKNIEGFYTVFIGDKKLCSFPSDTQESHNIISYLEQQKVNIIW